MELSGERAGDTTSAARQVSENQTGAANDRRVLPCQGTPTSDWGVSSIDASRGRPNGNT